MSMYTLLLLLLPLHGIGIDVADDAVYMSKLSKALTPTPPGWSQNSTDFCQWNGVVCGQTQNGRRVNAITLPSSSLNGELPPGLNSLSDLTHLDLHNNSLSGPIPFLANLSSLETVYLGDNNFASISNDCFRGLTTLHTLNLNNNPNLTKWVFPTDLTQSPSLRTLELAATNMTLELPAGIFDWFPSLQSVDLSSNNITGSLPRCLRRSRSQIRQLRLSDNYLTGPIPDLSNCTDLSDLQLGNNYLTGLVPPSLMALPSLQNVSLDNNLLQGLMPVLFRKGVTVKATFEPNSFCRSDPGPCDPRVTTLLEIAASFGYPQILAGSWRRNDPCGYDDWAFIDCKGVEIVAVNFTKMDFGGAISPAFANLTSLRELTLNGNNLTGSIPQSLTSLSQLELLDLSNNNLSGQVPKFSSKVKLFTTGNVNLVGHSQGARDPSPVSGHSTSGDPSKTPNATSLRAVWIAGTRGIIGYIAPQIFSRAFGGVSHKSDVYSYDILILEMAGGRKNHDTGGSHTTEMYFLDWIYIDLEQGHTPVNCSTLSEEENDMVRKITMVSLWCIQMNPSDRPSMSKVIEMLHHFSQCHILQSLFCILLKGHLYKFHVCLPTICMRQIQQPSRRIWIHQIKLVYLNMK